MIPYIILTTLLWMLFGLLISLSFDLGVGLDDDRIIRSWKYALVGFVLCGPIIFILTLVFYFLGWAYVRVFNRFEFVNKIKKWMDE